MVFANRTRINMRGYRFWKRATTHNSRAVSHVWCCLYTGVSTVIRSGGGGAVTPLRAVTKRTAFTPVRCCYLTTVSIVEVVLRQIKWEYDREIGIRRDLEGNGRDLFEDTIHGWPAGPALHTWFVACGSWTSSSLLAQRSRLSLGTR
jgi:hypothetical protein